MHFVGDVPITLFLLNEKKKKKCVHSVHNFLMEEKMAWGRLQVVL